MLTWKEKDIDRRKIDLCGLRANPMDYETTHVMGCSFMNSAKLGALPQGVFRNLRAGNPPTYAEVCKGGSVGGKAASGSGEPQVKLGVSETYLHHTYRDKTGSRSYSLKTGRLYVSLKSSYSGNKFQRLDAVNINAGLVKTRRRVLDVKFIENIWWAGKDTLYNIKSVYGLKSIPRSLLLCTLLNCVDFPGCNFKISEHAQQLRKFVNVHRNCSVYFNISLKGELTTLRGQQRTIKGYKRELNRVLTTNKRARRSVGDSGLVTNVYEYISNEAQRRIRDAVMLGKPAVLNDIVKSLAREDKFEQIYIEYRQAESEFLELCSTYSDLDAYCDNFSICQHCECHSNTVWGRGIVELLFHRNFDLTTRNLTPALYNAVVDLSVGSILAKLDPNSYIFAKVFSREYQDLGVAGVPAIRINRSVMFPEAYYVKYSSLFKILSYILKHPFFVKLRLAVKCISSAHDLGILPLKSILLLNNSLENTSDLVTLVELWMRRELVFK